MKLFVGKLSYSTTNQSLTEVFERFGPVISCKIISDFNSGKSRGFAFLEMGDDALAQQAIEELNGASLDGRTIVVSEARPQQNTRSSEMRPELTH